MVHFRRHRFRCKRTDISSILDQLNKFDIKLKFTVDEPTLNNGKYKLPYLDFCIEWNDKCQTTKVYRKQTCSKKVMPWTSFAPNQWKSGTLVNFIRRAYTHSSDLVEMHREIGVIKKIYRKMGYPTWFTDNKIKNTLEKIFNPKEKEEKGGHWLVIYMVFF